MLTRRHFLKKLGVLTFSSAISLESFGGAGRSATKRSRTTLYKGLYPGWPWIAKGPDNILYTVFREGTRHMFSPEGKVLLVRSSDAGKTWSEPTVVVDHPGVDDRNAAVTVLPDGDLLVFFNTYTSDKESQAMWTRSTDGGRTWSGPMELDRANSRTRAGALVLQNGNLVLPYYTAPANGSLAGVSEDGGKTWQTYPVPDTNGFRGDEWSIEEIEPGRIVGIHRNGHPGTDGTFWKSESLDGGKTWSVPVKTNVRSARAPSPAQITLHNGVPTLIYSDRRMVSVSAVTTTDAKLVEWDLKRRVECYRYRKDESPIQDGSYPCSVQLDRETRLIVDYEILPDSKRITGHFVQFPSNWGKRS